MMLQIQVLVWDRKTCGGVKPLYNLGFVIFHVCFFLFQSEITYEITSVQMYNIPFNQNKLSIVIRHFFRLLLYML